MPLMVPVSYLVREKLGTSKIHPVGMMSLPKQYTSEGDEAGDSNGWP